MGKAYKIYSPKTDKFIRSRKTGKYIWEKPSYAKRAADVFREEYNLPSICLQIIEYDMIEVGPINQVKEKKDG